jgi:hypothetical protein
MKKKDNVYHQQVLTVTFGEAFISGKRIPKGKPEIQVELIKVSKLLSFKVLNKC